MSVGLWRSQVALRTLNPAVVGSNPSRPASTISRGPALRPPMRAVHGPATRGRCPAVRWAADGSGRMGRAHRPCRCRGFDALSESAPRPGVNSAGFRRFHACANCIMVALAGYGIYAPASGQPSRRLTHSLIRCLIASAAGPKT